MSKEFKEINFSVRPLEVNFANSVAQIARNLNISPVSGVTVNPIVAGAGAPAAATNEGYRNLVAQAIREKKEAATALEGLKGLHADSAAVTAALDRLNTADSNLRNLQNERRVLRYSTMPGASALLASQAAEIEAKRQRLVALGVDPARLTSVDAINHELSIRGMENVRNMNTLARVAKPVTPVAPAAASAGNAFDRAVRRLGGVAKRHPVLAGIAGLAAIGGAVKIARAREDGRIDPDSYYIMDNNSLSMVPRAFPSREAAMYMRDERYPGCAVNKGTTLLQKA